jgi:branched-chain amino acid transport system substrate-binding protein
MSDSNRQQTRLGSRRTVLKAVSAATITGLAGCLTGGGNGNGNGGGNGNGNGNGATTGSGNGDGNGDGDGGSEEPLTIVALEPMSGPFSVYGPRHRDGAQFAVDQINADGGVGGRNLELQVVDTESSGQAAAAAFSEAIDQDNAIAATGTVAGGPGRRAGQVAEENEVPLYHHAAAASSLTPKDGRYVFRTTHPATATVAKSQAQIVEQNGFNNVGVIYHDDAYGDEFRAAVQAYFPDDINLTEDTAPVPQTDFVPQLRQFPDDLEVMLSGHPAGISSMYGQMYEVGLDPELYLGALTPMEADYQALGDEIERSFASFGMTDYYSDAYAEVASTYLEETGGIFDSAQVSGWTSVQLVARSIEETGSTDPVDIAEATRTGSFDLVFANPLEFSEWGEIDNAIMLYDAFDLGESPDYWPDVGFSPEEYFRTDPLPAFDPDELDI